MSMSRHHSRCEPMFCGDLAGGTTLTFSVTWPAARCAALRASPCLPDTRIRAWCP